MRSIAVLCVVIAHGLTYLGYPTVAGWSGITGVCFFFVHTSLVLMFSMERDPDVGSFYLRRAFRIYPLWIVMVLVITLFHLGQFPPEYGYRPPGLIGFLSNLTLTMNIMHRQEIVGAGWTLPIEVDMYLFLPVLFFFARSTKRVWPLLLLDLFIVAFNKRTFGQVSFLPMCVPCFLPGILAYVQWNRSKRVLPAWTFPVLLVALIAWNQRYGTWQRNWISCLALGVLLPTFRELTYEPLKRAAHVVAKYSYGIYLTHITAWMVFVHTLKSSPMPVRLTDLLILLIAPPLLLYHLVEEPMIRLGAQWARRLHDRRVPRVTEAVLRTEPAP